jgi:hypothetical protein
MNVNPSFTGHSFLFSLLSLSLSLSPSDNILLSQIASHSHFLLSPLSFVMASFQPVGGVIVRVQIDEEEELQVVLREVTLLKRDGFDVLNGGGGGKERATGRGER